MFTFFIGYCTSFIFAAIALGIPDQIDAYLARREYELAIETGNRLIVKRAVLRALRGAL